jgi:glycosyltransferase involved in cell wall biosynthesis
VSSKLTVLITCKDERRNIRDCIESTRALADELLIADSGSTDGTLDVVDKLGGCRIVRRQYINSGNFKIWAIPQATHPWVFVVDADERATPELARDIRQVLATCPSLDGYQVFRNNFFMGHPIRHGSWGNDKVIRLIRRDVGRYREYTDHAEIHMPEERVGTLRGRLEHYTCWDFEQYFRKTHHYAQQQAELWRQEGRGPTLRGLVFNGILRFFRAYVCERGYLDGAAGFIVCALTGFYSFEKQARLWHQFNARSQREPEPHASSDGCAL